MSTPPSKRPGASASPGAFASPGASASPGVFASPGAFTRELERRLHGDDRFDYAGIARRRQTLVFERFLARIAAIFGDGVTLKGTLVLGYRLDDAPSPRELKLSIAREEQHLLAKVRDAGRLDLSDFLGFEVERGRPSTEDDDTPWSEHHFRIVPQLAGRAYARPFGVELSFDTPSVGAPELVTGDDVLDFAGITPPTLRLYPIGAHVAETFHAYTLPRARPHANLRDLPELALLASAQSLDARSLREALQRTFELRDTHPLPDHVPDPPAAWLHHYEAFARAERLPWAELDAVSEAVHRFLDPVLGGDFDATWDPEAWTFQPN